MFFKRIFLVTCFFIVFKASAQDQIVVRGDTLILPGGSKFWLGEEVTLGEGSLPDKSFNFIYFPIPFNIVKRQALKASFAGQKVTIKKFQRDGAYKNSYAYNIIVLGGFSDKRRFWCDVQGAINSREIIDNTPPKPKPIQNLPESKEARLAKLKKLYDSGDITKDEYETLKSKILNGKGPVTKKTKDGPVVF